MTPRPALIEVVRDFAPDFETLSEQNVQLAIASTASESKCLVLGLVDLQGVADSTSLREEFEHIYEISGIARQPSFTGSYYAEICKQQAKHGVIDMQSGTKGKSLNKYTLSLLGEELILPWAGNLLEWTIDHNINLKEFWGEPRILKDGETSGTLTLAAIFAKLSHGEASTEEITQIINTCIGDRSRRDLVGRELKKIRNHPYIEQTEAGFRIKDDRLEAIIEFLVIFNKMAMLDTDFLEQGRDKLRQVLENPKKAALLMLRVASKSNKVPDARRDYSRYARPLLTHIEARGGSIPMNQLDSRIFPRFTEDELRRFRRVIRAGRVPGISLLFVGQASSKNDTSHILVIPSGTNIDAQV